MKDSNMTVQCPKDGHKYIWETFMKNPKIWLGKQEKAVESQQVAMLRNQNMHIAANTMQGFTIWP